MGFYKHWPTPVNCFAAFRHVSVLERGSVAVDDHIFGNICHFWSACCWPVGVERSSESGGGALQHFWAVHLQRRRLLFCTFSGGTMGWDVRPNVNEQRGDIVHDNGADGQPWLGGSGILLLVKLVNEN